MIKNAKNDDFWGSRLKPGGGPFLGVPGQKLKIVFFDVFQCYNYNFYMLMMFILINFYCYRCLLMLQIYKILIES